MTSRIAITGHCGLPPVVEQLVDRELRDALAALDAGALLEVVVPAQTYRAGPPAEHRPTYDALFTAARQIHEMDFVESTSESHQGASERMLKLADELWAVWDGLPARGYGGTADVVAAARDRGLPVRILWPDGATR